jgi:signal transduction histidine kinase
MNLPLPTWTDTGLEVVDVQMDAAFARHVHDRDMKAQMEGMRRIARVFVESPETILKELVNAAVDLCGADSAGISVEREDRTDADFYHWVATAGKYSQFLNASLPRYPSACGICLDRGTPQRFRVGQAFFDLMGIEAPLVTDGILLPWRVEATRGTIFIMAHGRTDAFDQDDCELMQVLADFAAIGVRQHTQQKNLVEQAGATAAAAMANDLAHKINNPLQGLTNLLYLAAEEPGGKDARELARQAFDDLERLSALVKKLLAVPYRRTR